ncbi:hypothetical protein BD769DRAFT_1675010 [Suillus cothurnatus]|nr:hypothetical protein BD769DRAFT_1675010 [Suillus cothurnatus]
MSLSSFLLGGETTSNQKAIDMELDALFQTQINNKRKPDGEQRHSLKKHKSAPKESQRHDSPPKCVKLRENKKEKVDKRKSEAEEE